ncbi:outer membrane beta-barrel protein [Robiginitalea sp. M366]|uniref:outer membrane beta-barrel protein n=1 Tax=Robiginitalea aestuariiviva TaxID=3036903 RepID=UPI00240DE24E|nr:outer membrane beta-barrel protein [Robiginitalea aestuariiviva]MDG1572521.1 outer membrane beta-barrel protein [Robiginitalea aestuariiviva]
MKRMLLLGLLSAFTWAAHAQAGPGFGIKAGLNYNANGDYFESAGEAARNPDRNVGYHLGVWGKVGNDIYLRPELIYTRTKSDYEGDDFNMSKLDVPVLLGAKVIGPLHVFGGPAFQVILDTEFDGISINDVENDFTVGLNLGAGINLGKLGIDLRYERGFSENEARFINTNITQVSDSRVDTRPDQLILSFSLKL